MALRRRFSSFSDFEGSPSGCGIATAGTILLAPIDCDIGTIVQTWTVRIPAFSNSLAIVAPQRVHDPHVELMITALTPSFKSSAAISSAKFFELETVVPFPAVV